MRGRRERMQALALAGIGAGFALAFLAMSVYIPVGNISFSVLSGAGIMLPLARGYAREGILAYVAASLLGLFYGPVKVVGFVLLWGLYPVIVYFLEYKLKPKVTKKIPFYIVEYALKFAYFNLIGWAVLAITPGLLENFTNVTILGRNLELWAVIVLANIAFLAYDLVVLSIYKTIKHFIARGTKL